MISTITFEQHNPNPFDIFSQLQDQFFEISDIDLLIDALTQINNQCKKFAVAIDDATNGMKIEPFCPINKRKK